MPSYILYAFMTMVCECVWCMALTGVEAKKMKEAAAVDVLEYNCNKVLVFEVKGTEGRREKL